MRSATRSPSGALLATALTALTALALLALDGGALTRDAGRPAPTRPGQRALLVLHLGPTGGRPRELAAHRDALARLPFDAVTVELPGVSGDVLSARDDVTREQVAAALAPMPRSSPPRHDLVALRTDPGTYDPADTAGWARVERNVRAMARAVRAQGGFDGVFVDTEQYADGPSAWSARDGRTLDGLARRAAGLAAAFGSEWPGAVLLTTYGPWVGDPRTATAGLPDYGDVSASNAGTGRFAAGLALGCARSGAVYVDGGELYRLHSRRDFRQAYDWLKRGVARRWSPVLPPALLPTWPRSVSVAFGVYDRDVTALGSPAVGPAAWGATLTAALLTADRYVWAYSDTVDWLGTQPDRSAPSPAVVAAARAAVRAAATAGPSGPARSAEVAPSGPLRERVGLVTLRNST